MHLVSPMFQCCSFRVSSHLSMCSNANNPLGSTSPRSVSCPRSAISCGSVGSALRSAEAWIRFSGTHNSVVKLGGESDPSTLNAVVRPSALSRCSGDGIANATTFCPQSPTACTLLRVSLIGDKHVRSLIKEVVVPLGAGLPFPFPFPPLHFPLFPVNPAAELVWLSPLEFEGFTRLMFERCSTLWFECSLIPGWGSAT